MARVVYPDNIIKMVDRMLDLHIDYQEIIEQVQQCFPSNNYTENQLYKLIEKCLVKRL